MSDWSAAQRTNSAPEADNKWFKLGEAFKDFAMDGNLSLSAS